MKNHISHVQNSESSTNGEKLDDPTVGEQVLCEQLFVGGVSWLHLFVCSLSASHRQPSTRSVVLFYLAIVWVTFTFCSLSVSLICFSKGCLKKAFFQSAPSFLCPGDVEGSTSGVGPECLLHLTFSDS